MRLAKGIIAQGADMGIDKESDIAANLQIGPTSLGMVRIYVEGDGEDPKASLPGNWREIVRQQCERLGWTMVYEDAATPTCAAPDQVQ